MNWKQATLGELLVRPEVQECLRQKFSTLPVHKIPPLFYKMQVDQAMKYGRHFLSSQELSRLIEELENL